jgi:hypothetical protein
MNTNEFNKEYFVIGRANNSNHPLLTVTKGGGYEEDEEYVENPKLMEYRLGKPVPAKPVMVDYHSSPYSVVSKKIYDVLTGLNLKDIQLIPATITGKNDELYENYWFLNIYNNLAVLDREKSKYDWNDFLEVANPIEKLVLSGELLNDIPLEDRLVFRLEENTTFEIFHKSVVDAIMATNPEGIQFTKVEDYHI